MRARFYAGLPRKGNHTLPGRGFASLVRFSATSIMTLRRNPVVRRLCGGVEATASEAAGGESGHSCPLRDVAGSTRALPLIFEFTRNAVDPLVALVYYFAHACPRLSCVP